MSLDLKTPDLKTPVKTEESSNRFRQALRTLRWHWNNVAGGDYDADWATTRPDLPEDDQDRLRRQMRDCLEARGGEVTARGRAAALGRAYLALDSSGRERFLRLLATDFDVVDADVEAAIEAIRNSADVSERRLARRQLRRALESPRTKLLTQFNGLPEGVKFLVNMRAELQPLLKRDPSLLLLEDDLRALLATWFDVDFLELRRITWDTASGALLEKLIAYEAVHPIESWEDIKDRLDYDRRYYAYFHPRMPNEPLIFVEVALVKGMADNVQALLDPQAPVHDPAEADTAIFYSINNAQRGLNGISFGNFLIKRVVDQLTHEFPQLKTFATLSPIPGFVSWLKKAVAEGESRLILPAERKALGAAGVRKGARGWLKGAIDAAKWTEDEALTKALRTILMRLCIRYLVREKRANGGALDSVAHFHLSNGARMERLNWMGDRSARGLRQSAGMMINYRYDLARIDANHESYRASGKVALSSAVKALLDD